MLSADEIRRNVEAVRGRIADACARRGRRPEDVTLVAVTKTFPAEAVEAAIAAGVGHIGENRVQEARDKRPVVPGTAAWHLIGHLQSNKAKDAIRLFDMIESVDSLSLAGKLAKVAEAAGKRQEVLLQVNIGREPQKDGVDPADVEAVAREMASMESLALRGLMSIPPIGTPEETRRWFRELRIMREGLGFEHLSMGMTEDFEVAIEEGSTIVRVGRAIFGARD